VDGEYQDGQLGIERIQVLDKRETAAAFQDKPTITTSGLAAATAVNASDSLRIPANHQVRLAVDQLRKPMPDNRVIIHKKHSVLSLRASGSRFMASTLCRASWRFFLAFKAADRRVFLVKPIAGYQDASTVAIVKPLI